MTDGFLGVLFDLRSSVGAVGSMGLVEVMMMDIISRTVRATKM